MALYAIGDVQGCFAELEQLLARFDFNERSDELVFVGDLVNRGPASLEVLRFVRSLGDRARTVLGNHDLHLLTVAEGLSKLRPDDTLAAVLAAPDRDALLAWLRNRPMLLQAADTTVVHAGLLPQWSITRAFALAGEVERALRGPGYRDFLANLYGGWPVRWDDALAGADRLRVIVNAMTRLRFCDASGTMEFASKGGASAAPAGFMPWYDAPTRASANDSVLFGHWSALGLLVREHVLAIDCGCVWGGALTALRLPERVVFQVPCRPAAGRAAR